MSKTDDLEQRVIKLEETVKRLEATLPPRDAGPPATGITGEHQKILDQIKAQEALLAAGGLSAQEKALIEARLEQLRELEADLRKVLQNPGGTEPE